MHIFGQFEKNKLQVAKAVNFHSKTLFSAVMDREALWDPSTIEKLTNLFPAGHLEEADLFLILAECIANAVLHGQADVLGVHARRRGNLLLISFYQVPPLLPRILEVLETAKQGKKDHSVEPLSGGLGFPILIRLVRKHTISSDLTRLQLWIQTKE